MRLSDRIEETRLVHGCAVEGEIKKWRDEARRNEGVLVRLLAILNLDPDEDGADRLQYREEQLRRARSAIGELLSGDDPRPLDEVIGAEALMLSAGRDQREAMP